MIILLKKNKFTAAYCSDYYHVHTFQVYGALLAVFVMRDLISVMEKIVMCVDTFLIETPCYEYKNCISSVIERADILCRLLTTCVSWNPYMNINELIQYS